MKCNKLNAYNKNYVLNPKGPLANKNREEKNLQPISQFMLFDRRCRIVVLFLIPKIVFFKWYGVYNKVKYILN